MVAPTYSQHGLTCWSELFIGLAHVLDALMCFDSAPILRRLGSLVLLTPHWGLGLVAREPFALLPLASQLRSAQIREVAFKSAVLQFTFYVDLRSKRNIFIHDTVKESVFRHDQGSRKGGHLVGVPFGTLSSTGPVSGMPISSGFYLFRGLDQRK